jgi:hypothetical protein
MHKLWGGDSVTGNSVQDCFERTKSAPISAAFSSVLARLWPNICEHEEKKAAKINIG